MVTRRSFPGSKGQDGRSVKVTIPSRAGFKDEMSYTYAVPYGLMDYTRKLLF